MFLYRQRSRLVDLEKAIREQDTADVHKAMFEKVQENEHRLILRIEVCRFNFSIRVSTFEIPTAQTTM